MRERKPTPPPFLGGQGRSSHDVRETAKTIVWFFLAGIVLILALYLAWGATS